jgi:chemotaxis protein MotA
VRIKMQVSTLLGVTIGVITLVGGMILKGANPLALVNPAALVIIFVGTAAALLNSFPMSDFAKIVTMFRLIVFGGRSEKKELIARQFINFAQTVRKDGLLALENAKVEDQFTKVGLSLVVDGVEVEIVDEILESQIEALEGRHKLGSTIFAQAGMYAPTLGVLGAVIGLISALGNLNDVEALGHAIAAAFVATLFGIFSGYVLWHPFANKLKQISRAEVDERRMIIEGIKALQAGDNPRIMQIKMLSFLPGKKQEKLMKELGG